MFDDHSGDTFSSAEILEAMIVYKSAPTARRTDSTDPTMSTSRAAPSHLFRNGTPCTE